MFTKAPQLHLNHISKLHSTFYLANYFIIVKINTSNSVFNNHCFKSMIKVQVLESSKNLE